jgi:heme/copper-type cytochrome/quinol oxidase subunit 3
MIATLILGSLFLLIQFIEYKSSTFCFADGIYGSTFFMLTGFHGLHVMVGTILLYISLIRLADYQFSRHHHFGFEASV